MSLTSVVCKVFEGIMKDTILNYLESFNLIVNTQHGFLSGKSCVTKLITLFEVVTSIVDNGDQLILYM